MVEVFHNPRFLEDCFKGEILELNKCVLVAIVDVTELETAYWLTQNDGELVWGEDPRVRALAPASTRRSTSWGDLMIIGGVRYFVDGHGYKVLEL